MGEPFFVEEHQAVLEAFGTVVGIDVLDANGVGAVHFAVLVGEGHGGLAGGVGHHGVHAGIEGGNLLVCESHGITGEIGVGGLVDGLEDECAHIVNLNHAVGFDALEGDVFQRVGHDG